MVQQTWNKQVRITNPFLCLHTKLQRTSTALRRWARSLIGNNRVLLCAAKMLIGILDVAQDYRQLSVHEIYLKRDLKVRLLGMTAVAKLRAKQSARLTAIKASEASSNFFYMQANVGDGRTLSNQSERKIQHISYIKTKLK